MGNPLADAFTEEELKNKFYELGMGKNPAIAAKICLEALAAMGYKTTDLATPTEIEFTGLEENVNP